MGRELVVRLIGDDESLRRAFTRSSRSAEKFSGTIKEQVAETITARVKDIESLRTLSAEYALVARNAAKGSEVQVTAARLAAETDRRLAASQGLSEHALRKSGSAAHDFDREFGRASRGALAGSGIFRGLGRSIAFASGGFLAFASAGQFLRTSIDAAKEAAVTQAQLAAQFKAAGLALGPYQKEIDGTTERLSALAGFQNDELKAGFTTIFRVTGNVGKSLRDLATATDFARARHIDLASAATLVSKVEGGRFEQLRRQGIQVAKNATVEQALALVRAKVAGQAQAGTTEQERFGAILHNTEEIIGTGLLPTLNKYLASGSKWLRQMNESGDLQRKVASAADAFSGAVDSVAGVIKTANRLTGSFKNTLELLLALKFATKFSGIASSIGLIGTKATGAEGKVETLRGSLGRLAGIGVITVEILIATKVLPEDFKFGEKVARKLGLKPGFLSRALGIPTPGQGGQPTKAQAQAIKTGKGTGFFPPGTTFTLTGLGDVVVLDSSGRPIATFKADDPSVSARLARLQARYGRIASKIKVESTTTNAPGVGPQAVTLTAGQRNTFFDNSVSRILLRGGLGDIQQQLAAIDKASALISKRIAVTKDVTRKLNLEDQLLQLRSQRRDILRQATQDANDRARAARDQAKAAAEALKERLKEAAAIRLEQRTSRQFRELGLSSTGDAITPSVANLKKQLGSLASRVDTPRLRSELARIRKVLSEGIVPKDVRAKIAEMMADIRSELGKGGKQLTKFAHTNSDAILEGLGLDARTTRILRQRLSTIGAGGTVPGTRSLAFSGDTTVVHTTVNLDGDRVARNTTKHQRKAHVRRSDSRRGPYAGRN